MNLAVVAFVPHPPASASGRYRVYQMARELATHGVDLTVRPFLDERAFARLYVPGWTVTKAMDVLRGARRRWQDVGEAGRFDLALVHREIWPLVGDAPRRRLARSQPRWVVDFDDAVYLPNVSAANRAFAWLKPVGQPARLVAGARAVAAGNAWLADWARRQRPGRPPEEVEVIPTAVDTGRWTPGARARGPLRLAWIGSHSTALFLEPLRAALARLAAKHPGLELHVVGATFDAPGVRVVSHEWDERTEIECLRRADIGLAPLPDDDWARGKCGLKLLLYMALGLPAVASRVGVHGGIVSHCVDGMLADTPEAFEPALETLLSDPALRERLGRAARATVEARYSVRVVAPRLATLLKRAAETA